MVRGLEPHVRFCTGVGSALVLQSLLGIFEEGRKEGRPADEPTVALVEVGVAAWNSVLRTMRPPPTGPVLSLNTCAPTALESHESTEVFSFPRDKPLSRSPQGASP